MNPNTHADPHTELRALYMSLLRKQARFDEFKQLLAEYPGRFPEGSDAEPAAAAEVRRRLNARISEWIGGPFHGLSARQVQMWRGLVVEERINVALSPWRESNYY